MDASWNILVYENCSTCKVIFSKSCLSLNVITIIQESGLKSVQQFSQAYIQMAYNGKCKNICACIQKEKAENKFLKLKSVCKH